MFPFCKTFHTSYSTMQHVLDFRRDLFLFLGTVAREEGANTILTDQGFQLTFLMPQHKINNFVNFKSHQSCKKQKWSVVCSGTNSACSMKCLSVIQYPRKIVDSPFIFILQQLETTTQHALYYYSSIQMEENKQGQIQPPKTYYHGYEGTLIMRS